MGNMIGILSTVILVSTLATLIFAVGAYVLARRRRSGIEDEAGDAEEIPERTEPLRQAPATAGETTPSRAGAPSPAATPSQPAQHASPSGKDAKPVFRRLTAQGEQSVDSTAETDKQPGWDWE